MLAIRMQRTGRKGHAMFRLVVQDSRRTPTSGKVVANIGTYDPHTKAVTLNSEKATFYVEHGAQPSPRAARLLKAEGVKMPAWVKDPTQKSATTRHADKLRRNQTPEPAAEASAEPAATPEATTEVATAPAEPVEETPAA